MAIDSLEIPAAVSWGLQQLWAGGVYFAPVRHHSPACAYAVQTLIRELRPEAVLIEGPEGFTELIPLLLDARTRPPVAILSQTAGAEGKDDGPPPATAFFPLCEHSPEWVALREGAAQGAQLAFIDLPWRDRAWRDDTTEREARSLMAERYLAHSRYLDALAANAGCRDQAELWDRLFELRPREALADWRGLLADVFAYCAMARLEYEEAVLEAEGSLPRERHMAAHIARWRKTVAGPIVVVTGGFHTPALLRLHHEGGATPVSRPVAEREAWLIRYSFDRLDALNGYASGMPSPAYYQQLWEGLNGEAGDYLPQLTVRTLIDFAHRHRQLGLGEQLSTANVQAAQLQALRLAMLRGLPGPGRYELLDAVRSCFIKSAADDGTQGFTADLHRLLGGSRIGDIPPSAGSPPLLENVRRLARAHGLRLDDTEARNARLDLYRKPAHLPRSRFFHMMNYLDIGLAQWQGGPDFLAGARLDLMFEEWRYAWTPMVEARLIELSIDGQSLSEVAHAKLRREEALLGANGQGRSASHAVQLLIRACQIGLHERLPDLFDCLSAHLEEDAEFGSVVLCGHRLATLWRAREPLGAQQHPEIVALMARVWSAALYLLPPLAGMAAEAETAAIRHLLLLREFGQTLRTVLPEEAPRCEPADLHAHLQRILAQTDAAAGLCGAAAAILVLDEVWTPSGLEQMLALRFGAGAPPEQAMRFLGGLMAVAPELLLRRTELQQRFDRIVASWDEKDFVSYLPDLRHAFAQLKPQETADLAAALASLHGAASVTLDPTHHLAAEADLLAGAELQLALVTTLHQDGLVSWLQPAEADDARSR